MRKIGSFNEDLDKRKTMKSVKRYKNIGREIIGSIDDLNDCRIQNPERVHLMKLGIKAAARTIYQNGQHMVAASASNTSLVDIKSGRSN